MEIIIYGISLAPFPDRCVAMVATRLDNKLRNIMANPLPTNSGKIYNLATKMYNGIVAKGAAIPVTMVTAAQMLSSKTAFKNAEATFNASRNALRNSYGVFKPASAQAADQLLPSRPASTVRTTTSQS